MDFRIDCEPCDYPTQHVNLQTVREGLKWEADRYGRNRKALISEPKKEIYENVEFKYNILPLYNIDRLNYSKMRGLSFEENPYLECRYGHFRTGHEYKLNKFPRVSDLEFQNNTVRLRGKSHFLKKIITGFPDKYNNEFLPIPCYDKSHTKSNPKDFLKRLSKPFTGLTKKDREKPSQCD